jgi:flagellar basal-body rod protein FlgG
MRRVENVAMNLANSLTPGYKRQVAVSQPFAGMVDSATAAPAPGKSEGGMRTFVDVRAGALKKTGENLDLAIGGDGFFEIQTPDGPAYTRQGNFHTDERGRLVTALGQPVMGASGEITLAIAAPRIAHDGTVYDAASGASQAQLGRIRVVRFDDTKGMTSLGNGLLTAGSNMTELQASQAQVQQGFLENSNVSNQHEMVQLMQASRHFESVEKAIQGYDELMETAIRKLGEV